MQSQTLPLSKLKTRKMTKDNRGPWRWNSKSYGRLFFDRVPEEREAIEHRLFGFTFKGFFVGFIFMTDPLLQERKER